MAGEGLGVRTGPSCSPSLVYGCFLPRLATFSASLSWAQQHLFFGDVSLPSSTSQWLACAFIPGFPSNLPEHMLRNDLFWCLLTPPNKVILLSYYFK